MLMENRRRQNKEMLITKELKENYAGGLQNSEKILTPTQRKSILTSIVF